MPSHGRAMYARGCRCDICMRAPDLYGNIPEFNPDCPEDVYALPDPKPPLDGLLAFQCGDCGAQLGTVTVHGRKSARRRHYGAYFAGLQHHCRPKVRATTGRTA